mgnify:CR=1 FL=1
MTTLWILLPLLSINLEAKTTFIGSQFEVFSDLVESLMYDAIKKGNESDDNRGVQNMAGPLNEDFATQSMKILDNNISRRRMSGKVRVPIAEMKMREVVSDPKNKPRYFFSSKKIVSRQRKQSVNGDTGEIQTLASNMKTENQKEDVQSRLEKLRELFQMVKVSKKEQNINKSEPSPKIYKKRVFNKNRRVHGDNNNDADINTLKERSDVAVKEHRTKALANLFKIAGEDWVKSNVKPTE